MNCGSIFYALAPVLGPVLRFIYNVVDNYGLSIIIFSVVIKIILFPLSVKQYKSTLAMKVIQPELTKLQKKYANDKEKLQKEQMELYEKNNVNPMAGCLPMVIQMPILFALYRVIMMPLTYIMGLGDGVVLKIIKALGEDPKIAQFNQIKIAEMLNDPSKFAMVKDLLPNFHGIDFNFFGLNLSQTPQFGFSTISVLWIIPALSGITALLSMLATTKMAGGPAIEQQNQQMKGMMYVMPLMSVYFGFILPAGMGIYWIINNVIAVVQQYILNKVMFREDDDGIIEGEVVTASKNKKKKQ